MSRTTWLRPGGLGFLVVCIALVGCGPDQKARARVKGQVKFFDKHLTCGTVGFMTKDGRSGSANIDFDGNYDMNDAPIGDVTITVSVPRMKMGPAASGPPKPPAGVPEMRPPGGIGGGTSPMIDPSKIVEIPPRYESSETSKLSYTVVKGEQTHNITLSP
jgi:hypothetical protein